MHISTDRKAPRIGNLDKFTIILRNCSQFYAAHKIPFSRTESFVQSADLLTRRTTTEDSSSEDSSSEAHIFNEY